jgi:uncharacterized coiled-coil DUF342 family protein
VLEILLPSMTAVAGLAAAIFAALRFNREDATAVVNQQKEVLGSMRSLNEELQSALDRARSERDELRIEVVELRVECKRLRGDR